MKNKRGSGNHFTMAGDWIACLHCGERQVVIPGGSLPITPKAIKAWRLLVEDFQARHGRCPLGPESPLNKLEASAEAWEAGLFVGTSSATIFRVMMGRSAGIAADRLSRVGVVLRWASGIHNKSLMIDESVLVECSFNWLSAARSEDDKYNRFNASIRYSGRGVKEMIAVAPMAMGARAVA